MPAHYHTVPPGVWNPQMRSLSKDAVIVALYVYSCRDRRSEGLFELSAGRVAADTPLTHAEAEAAFTELDSIGMISYDTENEIVLDRHALRRMPLRHGRNKETGEIRFNKAMPSAVQHFKSIVDSPLKDRFVSLAATHSPDLMDSLVEAGAVEYAPTKGGWGGGELSRAELSPIREELSTEKRGAEFEDSVPRISKPNGSVGHTAAAYKRCRGCGASTDDVHEGVPVCEKCRRRDERWSGRGS